MTWLSKRLCICLVAALSAGITSAFACPYFGLIAALPAIAGALLAAGLLQLLLPRKKNPHA